MKIELHWIVPSQLMSRKLNPTKTQKPDTLVPVKVWTLQSSARFLTNSSGFENVDIYMVRDLRISILTYYELGFFGMRNRCHFTFGWRHRLKFECE